MSLAGFLKSKQNEVAEQRGDQPREHQDHAIMCRCAPNPRIPKHLQQRIVASHGRLVGEPNQSACQRCQDKAVLTNPPYAARSH